MAKRLEPPPELTNHGQKLQLPELELALIVFWWRSIGVAHTSIDVEPLTGAADPLCRLASPDPSAADWMVWLKEAINNARNKAARDAAAQVIDALVSGTVSLTGVRSPRIDHGGNACVCQLRL
jgi:hypothetical protein